MFITPALIQVAGKGLILMNEITVTHTGVPPIFLMLKNFIFDPDVYTC